MTSRPSPLRRWRLAIAAFLACIVVGAGLAAWDWYYKQYAWPRKIQMEVLGEVIVTHGSLLGYEGYAHWGEGMFRWTYAAPNASGGAWTKLCPSRATDDCEFIRHGKLGAEVETSVSYKNGVVTIEEWWM